MSFKGLRTGTLAPNKNSRKKRNCKGAGLNNSAGQRASARQRAKEQQGHLVVLSIEKAAGIDRK